MKTHYSLLELLKQNPNMIYAWCKHKDMHSFTFLNRLIGCLWNNLKISVLSSFLVQPYPQDKNVYLLH